MLDKDGKEEGQIDATITAYWQIQITSTCFGQPFCPSSGTLDCVIQLMVFCTQYVAGGRSGNFLRYRITHRQRIGYKIP